ncbi:unnamed protein product [Euphydryas editha]|uniref:Uncharacterized protein n=1 Tax=Euphydryas editha TaxID=104508 RepID=A0AAU9UB71_EUPED|nr:unnamed protein product [Euphydryas editha]
MYFFGIITVYLLLVSCYGDTEDTPVARAFIENKLVPNIVDQAPHKYIRVNYSSVEVKLGNYVNPLQTLFQPDVAYEANEDDLYTLMLFEFGECNASLTARLLTQLNIGFPMRTIKPSLCKPFPEIPNAQDKTVILQLID